MNLVTNPDLIPGFLRALAEPDYTAHITAASVEQLHQWLSERMGGEDFLSAVQSEITKRKAGQ